MSTVLMVLAVIIIVVHLYREYWTRRDLPQTATLQAFDGELLRTGDTVIARRPARGDTSKTIVCFPGFLEDMRYFQALYADVTCELILVNNANYHCAFDASDIHELSWPANPHVMGTIEHDGFVLGHVLQELANGQKIILHGHSRGGAVVLDCGRQFPQLTRSDNREVSAILEAAVLPQARTVGNGSDPLPHLLIRYFMPIVLGLSRNAPKEKLLKQPMMRPVTDLKIAICSAIYTNPKNYSTCVTNVKSIRDWQALRGLDLYQNFEKITVVVGTRDDVLDNESMLASGEGGQALNEGVAILRTTDTNHFPTLEQPHTMLALI